MRGTTAFAIGGLTLAACATGPSPSGARPAQSGGPAEERALPIPTDLVPHIRESMELGRILYIYDKASAIGTDVLKEHLLDTHGRGLGGWLTLGNVDEHGEPVESFAVLFISLEEPFQTLFRVDIPVGSKPTFKELTPPENLTQLGIRMFRAQRTAIAAIPHGRRRINPVVLPGATVGRPDSILVYLLTAEHIPGEMVFGVHYRLLISEDGTTVRQLVPLSKSELVVPPPDRNLPPGTVPVAAVVSQLVTDWPLETHVFVSLLHGRAPIYVATRRGTWLVIGDRITLVDDKPPVPKP